MTQSLQGKNIIVGITAGIAAYKAIEVVSRLRKQGANVKVVMTKNAKNLVSTLTLGEISGHPVVHDMWEEIHDWNVEHISLATWADAYLIVPATANIIGKIANGIADDMLSTTVMATKAKVFICPAMNTNMYQNPITQANIKKLMDLGYNFLEPATGFLACGIEGQGRLPEPVDIINWLNFELNKSIELTGKTVLITAGGTQEAIDPVRYIGNKSSGKMGYALAYQAALHGARSILISAPTNLQVPYGVECIQVQSACDMQKTVSNYYENCDAVIMAAAVADFRLKEVSEHKIKKTDNIMLELVKNPDILKGLGENKKHQKLVGFAAETQNIIEYGRDKVERKNLDFLVANDVSKNDAGFNVDTNEATLIFKDGTLKEIPNMSKNGVAKVIIEELIKIF